MRRRGDRPPGRLPGAAADETHVIRRSGVNWGQGWTKEVGHMEYSHHSRAVVATARPDRYRRQLVAHLGRRLKVWEDDVGHWFGFEAGHCCVTSRDDALVLTASANGAEGLARVQDVVGGHLERFGSKDSLTVTWLAVDPA